MTLSKQTSNHVNVRRTRHMGAASSCPRSITSIHTHTHTLSHTHMQCGTHVCCEVTENVAQDTFGHQKQDAHRSAASPGAGCVRGCISASHTHTSTRTHTCNTHSLATRECRSTVTVHANANATSGNTSSIRIQRMRVFILVTRVSVSVKRLCSPRSPLFGSLLLLPCSASVNCWS